MMGRIGFGLALAMFGLSGATTPVLAQDGLGLAHPASNYYRSAGRSRVVKGPQVRGFAQRRVGGYSFYREDVINTYGDARTNYSGYNVYRDPRTDRQTSFGPFDHGFFFNSRGMNAPYPND